MVTSDPADTFSLIYTTPAGSNWGKWSDPKVDDLAERALKEPDRAKRRQLYHELQRHILNGPVSAVPVAWVEGFHFKDKKVRGHRASQTFMKVLLS